MVRVVQFYQFVSCSSSAVYDSCRSFGSTCRSVSGSVCSVVRPVRAVCRFTVADQRYQLKALVDCCDFLPMERGLYSVKIFYHATSRTTFVNIFYPAYIYNVHKGYFYIF